MSRARPKIADYPFTTLVPNLGVVTAGEHAFTVADVPGLIEGASEGRGLGHEFLRHVERCAALVHVIDTATLEPGRDPVDRPRRDRGRARRRTPTTSAAGRCRAPRLVVLNKVDVPDGPRARRDGAARPRGSAASRCFIVSARRRRGAARADVRDGRDRAAARADDRAAGRGRPRIVLRPAAVDDAGFVVRARTPRRRGLAGARRASRSAGCGRPTSATTRRSASSPTGSTGSASRTGWSRSAPSRATPSLIGDADNAVVFDFEPDA